MLTKTKNTKKIKFSVITVTKNSEKHLEKNILSVQKQTYQNYEHIIITEILKIKQKKSYVGTNLV